MEKNNNVISIKSRDERNINDIGLFLIFNSNFFFFTKNLQQNTDSSNYIIILDTYLICTCLADDIRTGVFNFTHCSFIVPADQKSYKWQENE